MNKTRELVHLEHFRQLCPMFPDGEIEKSESPDFIVRLDGGYLGIEHTEIFQPGQPHGGSLQAQDSLAQRAVSRARSLWIDTGGSPLLVQISFTPHVKIAKQNIDPVAKAIVHAVGEVGIGPGEIVTLKRDSGSHRLLPREVVRIYIRRPLTDRDEEQRWRCSSTGFPALLTPQHIQNVIDKKEHKLDDYTRCAEMWLLIVADRCEFQQQLI